MTGVRRVGRPAAPGVRVAALWTLALALGGCEAGDPSSDAASSVTDSAGVRIAVSSAPDSVVPAVEVLRIGTVDGEPEVLFDGVRSVALADDGSIWVTDSHPSVRRYSGSGTYLGAVGGEGEGPGESPRGYGDVLAGDSTVLALAYTPMLQLFTWEGDLVGQRAVIAPGGGSLLPVGFAGRGDWFFRREVFPEGGVPWTRTSWRVSRGGVPGETADPLVTLPGPPRVATGHGWGSGSYFDGFPTLTVAGGRLYYSDAMEYEVRVFGADGGLRSLVRRDVTPVSYSPAMLANAGEEVEIGWRESLGSPIDEQNRVRTMEALSPRTDPQHLPHLDLVLASDDGTVWVRRADTHPRPAALAVARAMGFIRSAWLPRWKAESTFDVFHGDGTYRFTTRLPAEFVPMAATADRLYGMTSDELGVHYVVAYEAGGM